MKSRNHGISFSMGLREARLAGRCGRTPRSKGRSEVFSMNVRIDFGDYQPERADISTEGVSSDVAV